MAPRRTPMPRRRSTVPRRRCAVPLSFELLSIAGPPSPAREPFQKPKREAVIGVFATPGGGSYSPATYSASADDARHLFDGMPPGKKDEESAPPARGIAADAVTPLPAPMGWTLPDGVDDNILSEILLRLPPLPSSLPRASTVCKRWHSLACDPGFGRRFRRHHRRNAPLLGFFDNQHGFAPTLDAPDLVPPGRFSLMADGGGRYQSWGSRHGLVFILDNDYDYSRNILVWDPVTGDQHRIGIPPGFREEYAHIGGAVLRDADDVHFRVVLVLGNNEDAQDTRALACVYSSETNLWGDLISVPLPPEIPTHLFVRLYDCPAVLVGDSLYWRLITCGNFSGLLKFNLERQRLDVIQAPHHMPSYGCFSAIQGSCFSAIQGEDGGLGFLSLSGFTVQLWNRKTDSDGVASWVLGRTIQLDKQPSLDLEKHGKILLLGYDEKNNCVFLGGHDIFILQLQSLEFRLMDDNETIDFPLYTCHPFESVFAAGNRLKPQEKYLELHAGA